MKLKNLNTKLIVDELKKIYNEKNKGFDAFKFNEIKYIILSHLQTSSKLSIYSRDLIISSLLHRFYHQEITESNFNQFFENAVKEYFSKKEESFTLLTSLSIDFLPFRKIKINDSIIRIHGKKWPSKFQKSRLELLKRNRKKDLNDGFIKVTVQTKAKHFYDGFEQATYDLNIFRAFICFNINPLSELPISNDYNRAINKVRNGEFYSLHKTENGETVDQKTYWFETKFYNRLTRFSNDNKEILKNAVSEWISKFEKCNKAHKRKLSDVLNLYVDAFDEKDKHTCFLKGWIALESLLGTHDNNQIIKRCVSVFKIQERSYQKEILQGLRLRRNLIVHENDTKINSLVNCYHVQNYLYSILKYNNLKYYREIENNEEAIKLLDYRLTTTKNLKSELKVIKEVSKIKKYES